MSPDTNIDAKLVELIEVSFCHGEGTKNDPMRILKAYYTKDGKLLAETVTDYKPGEKS